MAPIRLNVKTLLLGAAVPAGRVAGRLSSTATTFPHGLG